MLKITTALPGGTGGAHDAAAKGKHPKPKAKTQSGNFGGAIFKITQARNGLANLSLIEGAFKGAPSYALRKAHKAADATIASSKTLQLLKASAHGKFRTSGRYSAATVRGTKWTVADRCDGTLTHDITDSVAVTAPSSRRGARRAGASRTSTASLARSRSSRTPTRGRRAGTSPATKRSSSTPARATSPRRKSEPGMKEWAGIVDLPWFGR